MRNFQCITCERFHEEDETRPTCDAFPNGIPGDLWLGKVSHEEQYTNEDLLYEPLDVVLF